MAQNGTEVAAPAAAVPELQPPNKDEMKRQITAVRSEIDELRTKLEQLDESKRLNSKPQNKVTKQVAALKRKINEINGEITEKQQEKDLLMKRVKELDKERRELTQRQQELVAESKFSSSKDVDKQIKSLEEELETAGHTSLRKEKEIMLRIRQLEVAKGTVVKELDKLASRIAQGREDHRLLLEAVRELQGEIEKLREQRESVRAGIGALQNEGEKERDAIGNVEKERKEITTKIEQGLARIKEIRNDFERRYQEFAAVRSAKYHEEQERADKERREQMEQQRSNREQFVAKQKEIDDMRQAQEIDDGKTMCDTLITYLDKLRSGPHVTAPTQDTQNKEFDPQAAAKAGMVVLDKTESDWLFSDRAHKKSRRRREKGEEETPEVAGRLHFFLYHMQCFDKLGVPIPFAGSDIPAALEQLQKKKQWYTAGCNGPDPFPVQRRGGRGRGEGRGRGARGEGRGEGRGEFRGEGRGRGRHFADQPREDQQPHPDSAGNVAEEGESGFRGRGGRGRGRGRGRRGGPRGFDFSEEQAQPRTAWADDVDEVAPRGGGWRGRGRGYRGRGRWADAGDHAESHQDHTAPEQGDQAGGSFEGQDQDAPFRGRGRRGRGRGRGRFAPRHNDGDEAPTGDSAPVGASPPSQRRPPAAEGQPQTPGASDPWAQPVRAPAGSRWTRKAPAQE
eukprot:TRINITY_DN40843_c0_g1_i1.p1 TRINITY_DN40843_c0_g1~~TRINITY_DN40843_c0_g1_i1.p1  ORF type:complete len:679 (+),score=131.53 TRINITY_DN40843_c0_g1_i1:29-2065(+)